MASCFGSFICVLIEAIDRICPRCGADISEYENKVFEEKLISALRHTERETVQRAVYILGKLKSVKALQPLFDLFRQTDNTFLKIEILNTLNEIGVMEAKKFFMKVISSDMGIIKRMAKDLIKIKKRACDSPSHCRDQRF